MPSFDDLLACPRCGGPLRALRCDACPAQYDAPGGIPDLRLPADVRTEQVRGFYMAAPFPGYAPEETYSGLRARASRSAFARSLDAAIPGDGAVLEMGCGTGQLSLFLASADRLVVGADLSRASLELAQGAAERFGVSGARFLETDVRAPGLRREGFDVVICNGVLHHTPDPRASFAALSRLVRPGGIIVVGVYNAVARMPLRARRLLGRLTGYRWIPGDPVLRERQGEPGRREAWVRDQYQHIEEHRHTIGEVRGWFRDAGLTWVRAYPSTLLGGEANELFAQEDDWGLERALAQVVWMRTLGREGGVFAAVGAKPC
jgi:2-polyprenyl-3-methyl-5-hydroxy-6-metoxy-1,4-benzoquinol methylase